MTIPSNNSAIPILRLLAGADEDLRIPDLILYMKQAQILFRYINQIITAASLRSFKDDVCYFFNAAFRSSGTARVLRVIYRICSPL
ncbi:hypothetical protein RJ498_001436 [Pluralibacter gergoviae]